MNEYWPLHCSAVLPWHGDIFLSLSIIPQIRVFT
jgi:hypothetical protein